MSLNNSNSLSVSLTASSPVLVRNSACNAAPPLAISSLRILGIDPGLRITGFGLIEKNGNHLRYLSSGCIKVTEKELALRLKAILQHLREVITEHTPHQVVVEKVFVNVNPQSTLLLGQARGAAICAAVLDNLPVAEYTALQIKQAVVGNGHAKKEQVQEMVRRLLKLPGYPSKDSADALACAICHAHAGTTMQGGKRKKSRGRSYRRGHWI